MHTSRTKHTLCALMLISLTPLAAAQSYTLVGSYDAPGDTFEVLPDGRLLILDGDTIMVQDAINASSYTALGSITPGMLGNSGAIFAAVNPSGTLLALGDNHAFSANTQDVLIVDLALLNTGSPTAPTVVQAPNYDGVWADDSTLFVSGVPDGDTGRVTRIDALSGTGTVVIDNLNGSAGGVALHDGLLYTGNGFGLGTGFGETGAIATYDLASLSSASSSVAFESGTLVADALSVASLHFDSAGSLIVGGSDSFGSGDGGFVSVIGQDALPGATTADGQQLFGPSGDFVFPIASYNPVTREILVRDFGSTTVLRYAVPAPGALAICLSGALVSRRRRRA